MRMQLHHAASTCLSFLHQPSPAHMGRRHFRCHCHHHHPARLGLSQLILSYHISLSQKSRGDPASRLPTIFFQLVSVCLWLLYRGNLKRFLLQKHPAPPSTSILSRVQGHPCLAGPRSCSRLRTLQLARHAECHVVSSACSPNSSLAAWRRQRHLYPLLTRPTYEAKPRYGRHASTLNNRQLDRPSSPAVFLANDVHITPEGDYLHPAHAQLEATIAARSSSRHRAP